MHTSLPEFMDLDLFWEDRFSDTHTHKVRTILGPSTQVRHPPEAWSLAKESRPNQDPRSQVPMDRRVNGLFREPDSFKTFT